MAEKSGSDPCASFAKALQDATKDRSKCDKELTAAGERAHDWTERAKKFAGTDMWCAADRADAEQAEKEVETAVANWKKKQADVLKARQAFEGCCKKNGIKLRH